MLIQALICAQMPSKAWTGTLDLVTKLNMIIKHVSSWYRRQAGCKHCAAIKLKTRLPPCRTLLAALVLYSSRIQRLFVHVQIYVRVSLRESLAEWRSVLQNIMESSPTATQLLLTFLSCSESQMLEDHLLTAQVPTCFVCSLGLSDCCLHHAYHREDTATLAKHTGCPDMRTILILSPCVAC